MGLVSLSPLLRYCRNTLLEGVIRSSSAYDTWCFSGAHVTLLYIDSYCHHIVHPCFLIMYHIRFLIIRYDSSSRNHSDPGVGGSVLFHTHTFSHFTQTYALLQLPFFMDSDVGCLYRSPLGKNPVIACSCVCRMDGSLAIYTIGIVPACCISCCIGTCWSGICGDLGTWMGLADVPCVYVSVGCGC